MQDNLEIFIKYETPQKTEEGYIIKVTYILKDEKR